MILHLAKRKPKNKKNYTRIKDMEVARMNIKFTIILFVLLALLAVFGGPPGY